jgi:hypothetical protein
MDVKITHESRGDVRPAQPSEKARAGYFLVGAGLALVIVVLSFLLDWTRGELAYAMTGLTIVYVLIATPILFRSHS